MKHCGIPLSTATDLFASGLRRTSLFGTPTGPAATKRRLIFQPMATKTKPNGIPDAAFAESSAVSDL
ncbi:MAG: hypothetical protein ACYST6_19570, partial [Planctomycetota bacterium]